MDPWYDTGERVLSVAAAVRNELALVNPLLSLLSL